MATIEIKHIIKNDKNIDTNLSIWLKEVKEWINKLGCEKIYIQTKIREAKDGDIRASIIIGIK